MNEKFYIPHIIDTSNKPLNIDDCSNQKTDLPRNRKMKVLGQQEKNKTVFSQKVSKPNKIK